MPNLTLGKGASPATRSRNTAILSMFAVIGGTWLAFRSLSPQRSQAAVSEGDRQAIDGEIKLGRPEVVSEADRQTMKGGEPGENKIGRAPHKGLTTP
ncbi:hypothetical protein BDV38DRAFT_241804 [Aspergillus pseudotamarii]|uniref:Uncharacterized protein n=2 Tax=Aspergillus subgen. Circumdati TaxID=2720871 RepID=A0A5N7AL57_9EURO|nr:uncharacterized protein BDV38DRAFT_241804 [Aspergillus pseudotamarii]XP_031933636.1 uncharacterized protein BDV27DRAFT_119568 [Aspergillus caelatus]KAE8139595.1 hypothetical protein BDV38DRAFT_241804 [Aspergillus pseudotamarii]KAE8370555.1 hypothetical protein BDV27DRAFT_119568 [Aspergillus caelatus]